MKKTFAWSGTAFASFGLACGILNYLFAGFIAPEMDDGYHNPSEFAMNVVRVLGLCQGMGIGIGCVQIGISTLLEEQKA